MAKKFIDRKSDLATLEEQYSRTEASLVVVYGRRRIGKTTLLSKFIEDKRALYFLATEESDAQNRDAFRIKVADFTNNSLLASASIDNWYILFEELAKHANSQNEHLVLVIDEFQYLGKTNPAFPSIFQKAWDTALSKCNIMVVICGSLISSMTSQTLSESSPLYGRRTAQIRMTQIPFAFYDDFFDCSLTERQLIERYSVTGGVPKYIEMFEGTDDIFDLIAHNILNKNSFLFDEPNFLLSKEVNEVGSYFSIIKAIAAGNHKLSDISSRLGIKSTGLTKYLKTLENLDIIERQVPVTEKNPQKSKRGLYFLKDNNLRFWFRFVFPNLDLIETGHADIALQKIRDNFTDAIVALVYEDVCKQRIWELAAQKTLPFMPEKVGRWWGSKDVEIDIVAISQNEKRILFGECKFWKNPVGINVLDELRAKATHVDWHIENRKETYVLFSISGYTKELEEIAKNDNDILLF